MTKLSVCIPIEPGMPAPDELVRQLLANPDSSVEIVLAAARSEDLGKVADVAMLDTRLTICPLPKEEVSAAQLWLHMVEHARGNWLTFVNSLDMIEPDMPRMLDFAESEIPGIDALAWNAFHIEAAAAPDLPAAIAVPMAHHVMEMEKTALLQAFFNWQGARRVPMMPFGLFHGAIRRTLAKTIIEAAGPVAWLTPSPQYEWSARVLLFAGRLALSNRPLSAIDVQPYRMVDIPSALQGFPFGPRLGITASIAEIQARVLLELGSEWSGFNEDFVRACVYDCVMEHDIVRHKFKSQGYRDAIGRMPGGAGLVRNFQPHHIPHLPPERQRGRSGTVLLVDRFIAGAKTTQQFYAVVNDMMAPITVVVDTARMAAGRSSVRSQSFAVASRVAG